MQFEKIEKLDLEEWYNIHKTEVYKNSEGFKSILDRVKDFLEEIKIKYSDKSILIVTHGDVCKAVYSYLNNITDAKRISLFKQGNCEIKKYIIPKLKELSVVNHKIYGEGQVLSFGDFFAKIS